MEIKTRLLIRHENDIVESCDGYTTPGYYSCHLLVLLRLQQISEAFLLQLYSRNRTKKKYGFIEEMQTVLFHCKI